MPATVRTNWGRMPLETRRTWLRNFRALVAAAEPELCALAQQEVGKSRLEALTADVATLLTACDWLDRHAPRALMPRRVGSGPMWLRGLKLWELREPLGRVAILATWNYPIQLLGVQLAQALVAGNEVIVKPSERAPKTQALLLELAQRAGLPEGVIERVPATREAGAELVDRGVAEGAFDHLIFTGSTEVGRAIAQRLAPALITSTLELSGRDSAIVLDDADATRAARCIWAGTCTNAGQTCMGPRRALVHAAVYDEFVKELTRLAGKARPRTMIDVAAARHCRDLVASAVAAGGRALSAPGSAAIVPESGPGAAGAAAAPGGSLADDRLFTPVAVVDCPPDAPLVEGAHFGSALAVIKVANLAEALEIHRGIDQRLATSVFTRDPQRGLDLAGLLGSTTVTINDLIIPTAHPGVSIGGIGSSGWGLSRGMEGLLHLTRPVYASISKGAIRDTLRQPPGWFVRTFAWMIRWMYRGRVRPAPGLAITEDGGTARPGLASDPASASIPQPTPASAGGFGSAGDPPGQARANPQPIPLADGPAMPDPGRSARTGPPDRAYNDTVPLVQERDP